MICVLSIMAIEHQVAPFKEQDKLEEGLLRTQDGSYVNISRYGKKIADYWERFAKLDEQDKLKQGLIKIERIKDYVPIDNLGLIQNNDCFVATAVYGDKNAPQVQTLRDFRDNVLMRSAIGRAFVDFYYSGAGKKTADFVREHLPPTIPVLRKGLDAIVQKYSQQRK